MKNNTTKENLMLFGSLLLGVWGVLMLTLIFFGQNKIDRLFWPMVIMPIIIALVFMMCESYSREHKQKK
jgi:uncharacterized membrane protein YjdF